MFPIVTTRFVPGISTERRTYTKSKCTYTLHGGGCFDKGERVGGGKREPREDGNREAGSRRGRMNVTAIRSLLLKVPDDDAGQTNISSMIGFGQPVGSNGHCSFRRQPRFEAVAHL